MTSRTEMYNLVLDVLKEAARIDAYNEATTLAQRINRQYDLTRRELLQIHPWKFAKRRVSVNKYTTNPAFGWSYQYPLPDNYLQMHPIQEGGTFEGDFVKYDIESYDVSETEAIRMIVTNHATPIKFTYTADVENTGLFSPLFVRALVLKMAVYVGHAITNKASYVERADQLYKETMLLAKGTDNLSATYASPADNDWISVHEDDYNFNA